MLFAPTLLFLISINCEVSACVFRCGPLLSAGTASASSRNPLCGVFRHVLFPQDKEYYDSFCIARRKLVCIFEESTVLRSKQPPSSIAMTRTRLLLNQRSVISVAIINAVPQNVTSQFTSTTKY